MAVGEGCCQRRGGMLSEVGEGWPSKERVKVEVETQRESESESESEGE